MADPASNTSLNLQLVMGLFDASGNLVSLYGPTGVPLNFSSLPTTLPATAGLLWNNGGVLSIS